MELLPCGCECGCILYFTKSEKVESFEIRDGERLYGVPVRNGLDRFSMSDWDQISNFISTRLWDYDTPALPEDLEDPLYYRKHCHMEPLCLDLISTCYQKVLV